MDVLIAGFGVVGQGITEVIADRQGLFRQKFGEEVRIVGVLDSSSYVTDPAGLAPAALLERKLATGKVGKVPLDVDIRDLTQKLQYDTLLEVTPTNIVDGEPGYTHIRTALEAGRNVITSNKGPLALKFREITQMAEKNGVQLRYEASVGGAMPVVNLSKELLAGEKIISLRGILTEHAISSYTA